MPTAFFYLPAKLIPGKSAADLETFWLEEYLPNVKHPPGVRHNLVKGAQGLRTGQYALISYFESNERQNELFPLVNGQPSAAGSEEWQQWLAANPTHAKLYSFFDAKWMEEFTVYHGVG